MKQYQKQAIKLASEILAQPQFRSSGAKADRYLPHRWCALKVINADCHAKKESECKGDRLTYGCACYKEQ